MAKVRDEKIKRALAELIEAAQKRLKLFDDNFEDIHKEIEDAEIELLDAIDDLARRIL